MYLLLGPVAALIGIAAVYFVLRRKSVDKRSMYSARRQQIEHKVRAARERTLAPHGRTDVKPGDAPAAAAATASIYAPQGGAPPVTYQPSAFESPPAAPPPAPSEAPPPLPSSSPWDVGPTTPEAIPWEAGPATPDPNLFAAPPPPPATSMPEAPPYEPPPPPPPSEPAWTPSPVEPAAPVEPAQTSPGVAPSTWSVVSEASKEMANVGEPESGKKKKKQKQRGDSSSWQLASGDAPGEDLDDDAKAPSSTVAIAQYAVLVVGLVMVLIGVLVMVANSHVT